MPTECCTSKRFTCCSQISQTLVHEYYVGHLSCVQMQGCQNADNFEGDTYQVGNLVVIMRN